MIEIPLLLTLFALGFFWYNQMKALDAVRLAAKQLTIQKNWAFLDDSVMQKHISIKPHRGRLALLREFQFEFSDTEAKRHQGTIIHHGQQVKEVKFYHESGIESIRLNR